MKIFQAEFNIFEHSSGKMSLYFYSNNSNFLNVKINIRDGDYLDKNVIIIADLPLIPKGGYEKFDFIFLLIKKKN